MLLLAACPITANALLKFEQFQQVAVYTKCFSLCSQCHQKMVDYHSGPLITSPSEIQSDVQNCHIDLKYSIYFKPHLECYKNRAIFIFYVSLCV